MTIDGKIGKKDVERELRQRLNFPPGNLYPFIAQRLKARCNGLAYPVERMYEAIKRVEGQWGMGYMITVIENDIGKWRIQVQDEMENDGKR